MSDASGTTSLTVDEVIRLIADASAGTTDPVRTSLTIFQRLGENIVLSGDILKQALSQASLSLGGWLAELLLAVESVTKAGNIITIVNDHELHLAAC